MKDLELQMDLSEEDVSQSNTVTDEMTETRSKMTAGGIIEEESSQQTSLKQILNSSAIASSVQSNEVF